jgi:predicted ATPase
VTPLDEETLDGALARLVEAELLYQRGSRPDATFTFKHALVQEVAYQSMLLSNRRRLHQRIAAVLTEQFPETVETQPELLAHHYTEAGLAGQAVTHWRRAAERAVERSANLEANAHLTRGLQVLGTMSPTHERDAQELALHVVLGAALISTRGYADVEVERVYSRARELCETVGNTPKIFPVLRGLAAFHYVRAELRQARELAEHLLELAYQQEDLALRIGAHLELGSALSNLGEFRPAREHLVQGIVLYDRERHRSQAFTYGQDLGVSCLARVATVLACLGYLDQALDRSEEALKLARDLGHPYSITYALSFAAAVRRLRGEPREALRLAEAAIRLSAEQGSPFWVSLGSVLKGWALSEAGELEDGIGCIRRGLASSRALGAEITTPYFLGEMAETCGKGGHIDEGLVIVNEAVTLTRQWEDRWYESALQRIKGDLLFRAAAEGSRVDLAEDAEDCLRRAIDIADAQHAKTFKLSAAMSLGRLLYDQGRSAEAFPIVRGAVEELPEGHDTPEVRKARAWLEKGPLEKGP